MKLSEAMASIFFAGQIWHNMQHLPVSRQLHMLSVGVSNSKQTRLTC